MHVGAEACNVDHARNLYQIRAVDSLALPPRDDEQSLHAYVHEHLRHLEHARSRGIPYRVLVRGVLAAGFANVRIRTIQNAVYEARKKRREHAPASVLRIPISGVSLSPTTFAPGTPAAEAKGEKAAMARRLRELARPPRSGEPDPLD